MRKLGVGCLLLVATLAHAQDSTAIREASNGTFVGVLTSDRELSIEEAQRRVLETAAHTCKDLIPTLGHYQFESSKQIAESASAPSRFEFKQNFTCQEQAAVSSVDSTSPTVVSEEEKARLVELVTRETRMAIASGDRDVLLGFHGKFSPDLSEMIPLAEWTEQQTQLHKKAGAAEVDPLLKVTTYLDPPNSPGPGLYIAVDFQMSYENAPFRCGYVMWLIDQQSSLKVLRLEDGIIYDKDAASMTAEQIARVKQQFRCFA